MEFEKVFPELCSFGKYQKLIFYFILLPVQLTYYCHIYSHLFLTYQPTHWCKFDHLISTNGIEQQQQQNFLNDHQNESNSNILKRYYFIPSNHMIPMNETNQLKMLMDKLNYSFSNYVDTLSSCHIYNVSNLMELSSFNRHLFQMFIHSNESFDHLESAIPPIVQCNDWSYNQTWLGEDQSIVTKVCYVILFYI